MSILSILGFFGSKLTISVANFLLINVFNHYSSKKFEMATINQVEENLFPLLHTSYKVQLRYCGFEIK